MTGLHEAAVVLQNATIKKQEDRLAEYIVRLQTRSSEHPELDGAFFRAWDYRKWEVWASDADIGWYARACSPCLLRKCCPALLIDCGWLRIIQTRLTPLSLVLDFC